MEYTWVLYHIIADVSSQELREWDCQEVLLRQLSGCFVIGHTLPVKVSSIKCCCTVRVRVRVRVGGRDVVVVGWRGGVRCGSGKWDVELRTEQPNDDDIDNKQPYGEHTCHVQPQVDRT